MTKGNAMANEKTRIGIIGLNGRGRGDLLDTLLIMKDVEVCGLCDLRQDRLDRANAMVEKACGHRVPAFTDADEFLAMPDMEGVVIATSWDSHIPLAVKTMRAGKRPGIEVGPAQNLEDCWALVRTSEETGVPCMILENCDYGERELAILQAIRKGLFGEITHVEGGYKHDMRGLADDLLKEGSERAMENLRRNGDMYPSHELGPIMNWLNVNRGNRMLTLTSMASKAVGLTERYMSLEGAERQPLRFRMGDVITTMIKCAGGETILLTHDTFGARPYSRGNLVRGTRGLWSEDMASVYIEGRSEPEKWEKEEKYLLEFRHPFWKKKDFYYKNCYHHGGMDVLTLSAFAYSVRTQTPPPIDVYDAATMCAVPVLSEQSIALGSMPVPVPDFTSGRWICPKPQHKSIFSLDEFHWDLLEREDWDF